MKGIIYILVLTLGLALTSCAAVIAPMPNWYGRAQVPAPTTTPLPVEEDPAPEGENPQGPALAGPDGPPAPEGEERDGNGGGGAGVADDPVNPVLATPALEPTPAPTTTPDATPTEAPTPTPTPSPMPTPTKLPPTPTPEEPMPTPEPEEAAMSVEERPGRDLGIVPHPEAAGFNLDAQCEPANEETMQEIAARWASSEPIGSHGVVWQSEGYVSARVSSSGIGGDFVAS
ncbi:MAG TPA: hypothetical protein VFA32_03770, partial [Dehalococcoidia bacterium]|nr:hypothetical protein [Dehalococcoidia bacterium]